LDVGGGAGDGDCEISGLKRAIHKKSPDTIRYRGECQAVKFIHHHTRLATLNL
jgi:hypothetical protein